MAAPQRTCPAPPPPPYWPPTGAAWEILTPTMAPPPTTARDLAPGVPDPPAMEPAVALQILNMSVGDAAAIRAAVPPPTVATGAVAQPAATLPGGGSLSIGEALAALTDDPGLELQDWAADAPADDYDDDPEWRAWQAETQLKRQALYGAGGMHGAKDAALRSVLLARGAPAAAPNAGAAGPGDARLRYTPAQLMSIRVREMGEGGGAGRGAAAVAAAVEGTALARRRAAEGGWT
ncbi:unnamed protein product [Pedinophyceae sp. YPF-701]|nr:unnamed protein product [Pedinophyceae sp. YPF-701]